MLVGGSWGGGWPYIYIYSSFILHVKQRKPTTKLTRTYFYHRHCSFDTGWQRGNQVRWAAWYFSQSQPCEPGASHRPGNFLFGNLSPYRFSTKTINRSDWFTSISKNKLQNVWSSKKQLLQAAPPPNFPDVTGKSVSWEMWCFFPTNNKRL